MYCFNDTCKIFKWLERRKMETAKEMTLSRLIAEENYIRYKVQKVSRFYGMHLIEILKIFF